jgi:hypothetical protein
MVSRLGACSVLLGLALGWVTPAAAAEPSESAKESARNLMAEARELRDRQDLQAALARFEAADAIMGVPTTGFEVARTQADLLLLIEARATLRRVLAIPEGPEDPEPFKVARDKAKALDAELGKRIGAIRVLLRGVPRDRASVTVNRDELPAAALDLPFRVNPGRHRVVVRSGGKELTREVDVPERETVTVELDLGEPKRSILPPRKPTQPSRSNIPTLTYAGGGLAVSGLLVGSASGLIALSKKRSAEEGCRNNHCPPATWADLDAAHSFATASTIGFVLAGVGAGVGAAGFWLGNRPQEPYSASSWQVQASPSGVRLGGRF